MHWPADGRESIEQFTETIVDLARVESVTFVRSPSDAPPGHLKVLVNDSAVLFIDVHVSRNVNLFFYYFHSNILSFSWRIFKFLFVFPPTEWFAEGSV